MKNSGVLLFRNVIGARWDTTVSPSRTLSATLTISMVILILLAALLNISADLSPKHFRRWSQQYLLQPGPRLLSILPWIINWSRRYLWCTLCGLNIQVSSVCVHDLLCFSNSEGYLYVGPGYTKNASIHSHFECLQFFHERIYLKSKPPQHIKILKKYSILLVVFLEEEANFCLWRVFSCC